MKTKSKSNNEPDLNVEVLEDCHEDKFGLYVKKWRIGKYKVVKRQMDFYMSERDFDVLITVDIERPGKNPGEECLLLPEIYANYKEKHSDGVLYFEICGFEISTPACGCISPRKVRQMIRGYNYALKVVKKLERLFLKSKEHKIGFSEDGDFSKVTLDSEEESEEEFEEED